MNEQFALHSVSKLLQVDIKLCHSNSASLWPPMPKTLTTHQRVEMCRNKFFVLNPSRFDDIKPTVTAITFKSLFKTQIPFPFFHEAILNFLPFPFRFGNSNIWIFMKFFSTGSMAVGQLALHHPTTLNRQKKASKLTIKLTANKQKLNV